HQHPRFLVERLPRLTAFLRELTHHIAPLTLSESFPQKRFTRIKEFVKDPLLLVRTVIKEDPKEARKATAMTPCPSTTELFQFLECELGQNVRVGVLAHVETCTQCQRGLDDLTSSMSPLFSRRRTQITDEGSEATVTLLPESTLPLVDRSTRPR